MGRWMRFRGWLDRSQIGSGTTGTEKVRPVFFCCQPVVAAGCNSTSISTVPKEVDSEGTSPPYCARVF